MFLLVDLTTWLDKNKLSKILNDHEYHEISDEDTVAESPRFEVSQFKLIVLLNLIIVLNIFKQKLCLNLQCFVNYFRAVVLIGGDSALWRAVKVC